MGFLLSLLACFGIFWIGMRLFWKFPQPPQIDSLRKGRVHYLLWGALVGVCLPQQDQAVDMFGLLQIGTISLGLMWFGIQTGLSLDLQHLRRLPLSGFTAQIVCALLTVGFTTMAAFAGGTRFAEFLGLVGNFTLTVLLLSAFALAARFPEPTFRWSGAPRPPSADLTPTFQFGNTAALLVLAIGFPFCTQDVSIQLGTISFTGAPRVLALIGALGLTGGIAMDFVLRAYRNVAQGMALAFGIMIALAGLCSTIGVPALGVGFLSGIWLVNATVVKRDVKERITRSATVVEPLFFLMLGTLIAGLPGQPTLHAAPLVPFALVLLLVRSMGRTLGLALTRHLWHVPKTWGSVIELSLPPLGNLSTALAAQAYFILPLQHPTLIAGLILAVFFSQIILFAPMSPEPRRGLVPISSRE